MKIYMNYLEKIRNIEIKKLYNNKLTVPNSEKRKKHYIQKKVSIKQKRRESPNDHVDNHKMVMVYYILFYRTLLYLLHVVISQNQYHSFYHLLYLKFFI